MRAVPLLLAVAALAACGGSGGRLSKSEYASKADAICAKYNRKINALGSPRTLPELASFADKAIPLAKKGNRELKQLEPPKDEETTAKEWIAQSERIVRAIEKLRDAAKKGDRAGIRTALAEGNAANRTSNQLAKDLGLRVCAKS